MMIQEDASSGGIMDSTQLMTSGNFMMQNAFLHKKQQRAEQHQQLMLAQLQVTNPGIYNMVQNLINKNVQGIHETKFKVFGQVWSVFDWTLAIIVIVAITLSFGFTFLVCVFLAPKAEEEEEELQAEITMKRKKASLEKLLAATEGANLSGALLRAAKETERNERREFDATLVMAKSVDINALMRGPD